MQLIDRTPRLVKLSPEGEIFLQPARGLLATHGLARNSFNMKKRRMAIGFSNHLFSSSMPAVLSRLGYHDLTLQLEMKVGTTREILQALDSGLVDAAFVLHLDETRRNYETVRRETFGWMAAPDGRGVPNRSRRLQFNQAHVPFEL